MATRATRKSTSLRRPF